MTHEKPPQWINELSSPPLARSKNTAIPDPPGYISSSSKKQHGSKSVTRTAPSSVEMDILKLKKAWEVALAPVKQLPMTAIMMYMSGNTLQMFSIMMVVMAFKTPLMGLMSTNQIFEKFESDGIKSRLVMVKGVYVAMQILALALGIWKVDKMGLLPTTRSDWLAWEAVRDPVEIAFTAL